MWKTRPADFVLLEILTKKGAMADSDLMEALNEESPDLGAMDFNQLLLKLEVSGKIRVTSMARSKRRVELVAR